MASQGSGNTNTSPKARNYQLTLNQVDRYPHLRDEFKRLKTCAYFISCKEIAPTTGHEHIHIYVHFSNTYKLSKKILSYGAHVEVCRSSPKQNIAYIRKDGNILDEWGEEPHQGNQYTVNDLRALDDPGELDWRIHNTWQKIHTAPKKVRKSDWNKNITVYYIWGPSGAGKSNMAQELADDEFEEIKNDGKFWIGVVDGTGCAIYDDFRDSHMKASEFINFIDYRSHNMDIKGGSIRNLYTKVIITSVQSPDEIYRNCQGEPRTQWMRRMKIIQLESNTNIDDQCI